MSGFTKSYRSKWENPAFRNLREAGIWAWMCDTAVWKPTRIRFNGELVFLERGQLVTSIRFISKGFKIGERVTRTFLDVLTSEGMIDRQTTHKATIITICNYEKYQEIENATDTQPTRNRHATDTNKKEEKKKRSKEYTLEEWEIINGELTLIMVPAFVAEYGPKLAQEYLNTFRNSCMAKDRKYVNFGKALQTWKWEKPKSLLKGNVV